MGPRTLRQLTLLLGLTLFTSLAPPATAQEPHPDAPSGELATEADRQAPAISLQLSPAVLEVVHEVGEAAYTLRVDNTGRQPLRITTETAEFTVTPDGATQFRGPEEVGAAAWVDVATPTFELAPGEGHDVEVTVEVPADAEPGERYVSIIFAVPGSDDEGNIRITHRVATKLYISVPGDQVHHLELGELNAPWLVDSRAVHFELTVHNRGNVHRRFEDPEQLVATSGDAEFLFQNFTVLGDSTRVVDAVWADPPVICWCSVQVATDDGRGNLITASTRVVLFPLRVTLALLAVTAGLAMYLAGRRRRQAEKLARQLEEARQEGRQSVSQGPEDARPPGSEGAQLPGRGDAPGSSSASPDPSFFTAKGSGRGLQRRRRRR